MVKKFFGVMLLGFLLIAPIYIVAAAAPALACRPIIMDGITIDDIELCEEKFRLEILCDEQKNLANVLEFCSKKKLNNVVNPQQIFDQPDTAIKAHDAYLFMNKGVSKKKSKGIPLAVSSSVSLAQALHAVAHTVMMFNEKYQNCVVQ